MAISLSAPTQPKIRELMPFAQLLLFLLMASVTNGLPIASNSHVGPTGIVQGSSRATASEAHLKAVASVSTTYIMVRTPPSETIIPTRSILAYRPSSDTLWNNTTTETSADIDNLTTDSPSTFLKDITTSSAQSFTSLQTMSSPPIMTSSILVATLTTTANDHPTPNMLFSYAPTTSDAQTTPLCLLSCLNTTNNTNSNDDDGIITQIYHIKLIATVLGALHALVQLCETQVITTTRRFLTDMVKTIYSRGKRSMSDTISWFKKFPRSFQANDRSRE